VAFFFKKKGLRYKGEILVNNLRLTVS